MAQWAGQFTGNTHGTRLEDAEQALREAVATYRSADAPGAVVLQVAERVATAREQFIRARLSTSTHVPTEEALAGREKEIISLKRKLEVVLSGGVNAVLEEFGVPELISS